MAVYLLPSWLATAPPPPPPLLMDSPSTTASDDEDHHHHHQGSDGGKKKHVMFLVSHMEAGCIIGKAGSIVKSMESQSGARINISRHDQLFPGTTSRVVLVSGLFNQLMDAMELILERLVYQGDQVIDSKATIALVVPSVCCGALIGKGGATLKAITQKASAGIKISPQDNSYGLHDRLVTITGSLDNQLRAIFLILSKLLEDVLYSIPIARIVFSRYPASPVEYENVGSDEHVGRYQNKVGPGPHCSH
ncbi:hypothetical protein BRADI_1g29160v3 [Brachypodium distachyon]|uniref:K Homology domain-containing protein n=1 Tax=Brachypodium distachyon TaxID=15368 RepID=A0A2K2DLU4_BRADI|nr:hypothetical protein BRADI_1g29160v3 [Brachypodium distachyon]